MALSDFCNSKVYFTIGSISINLMMASHPEYTNGTNGSDVAKAFAESIKDKTSMGKQNLPSAAR